MSIYEDAQRISALAQEIPFAQLRTAGQAMDELSDQINALVGQTSGGQAIIATLQQSFTVYEQLISLWTKAQMDLQDLARHHMQDG